MEETRLPIQPGDAEWTKLSRGSRWDPRYQERWILNKEGKKRCRLCGVIKESSDFTPYKRNNGKGTVGGVMNECKDCMLVHSRDIWLRRKYGISQQQYDEMFQAQHYSCAICRTPGKSLDTMVRDHAHTGMVEGLCIVAENIPICVHLCSFIPLDHNSRI